MEGRYLHKIFPSIAFQADSNHGSNRYQMDCVFQINLAHVGTCSQRVYNHENIIHYAVAKCKQVMINIVINAGTMRGQKGDIC